MKKTATEGYPYSHGAAPREEEEKGVNPIFAQVNAQWLCDEYQAGRCHGALAGGLAVREAFLKK